MKCQEPLQLPDEAGQTFLPPPAPLSQDSVQIPFPVLRARHTLLGNASAPTQNKTPLPSKKAPLVTLQISSAALTDFQTKEQSLKKCHYCPTHSNLKQSRGSAHSPSLHTGCGGRRWASHRKPCLSSGSLVFTEQV